MSKVIELHPDKQLTPKQEAFVQAYLECGDMSEAYRRAYDTQDMKPETINRKAFELAKEHEGVAARIRHEQDKMREKFDITVEGLCRELDEAKALALTRPEGASAAVAAIMGKAKLAGLVLDRTDNTTTILDHRAEKPDFAVAQKRAGLGASG